MAQQPKLVSIHHQHGLGLLNLTYGLLSYYQASDDLRVCLMFYPKENAVFVVLNSKTSDLHLLHLALLSTMSASTKVL